ncbi:MAG: hypothetical protein KAT83_00275 [Candidatus Aenigmarchaeota archaeon]|nr:hypothetical protein [Candidatus Aenigmarchaeota archaeon]
MKKGQTLATDYVISLSVFAVILIASISLWNVAESKKTWSFDIDRMQKKAMIAADTLVKTGGVPDGWTNESVEEIGISSRDHVINGTLFGNMLEIPYADARFLFGLETYEFHINLTNQTGWQIASYGSVPQNAEDLALIRRIAFFENNSASVRAILSFYVWR